MRIALLAGGDGWHVRDLVRAAGQLGHRAEAVDFRRIRAAVGLAQNPSPRPPPRSGEGEKDGTSFSPLPASGRGDGGG